MGNEVHAEEIMNQVDTNRDGQISFDEFVHMMTSREVSGSLSPLSSRGQGSLMDMSSVENGQTVFSFTPHRQ